MAKSKVLINNKITRVTEWTFKTGEDTGLHEHLYDYVVIPMKDGTLKIEDSDGSVIIAKLYKGKPYFRQKGIRHNVVNNNPFHFQFIEIEYKF